MNNWRLWTVLVVALLIALLLIAAFVFHYWAQTVAGT
jgi:Tfp pilus assembly protein PilW